MGLNLKTNSILKPKKRRNILWDGGSFDNAMTSINLDWSVPLKDVALGFYRYKWSYHSSKMVEWLAMF